MKNKKISIIIFISGILLLVIGIVLIKVYEKNNTIDSLVKYSCINTIDWTTFSFTGLNGEDLGKYKIETVYDFSIEDNTTIKDINTEVTYSFSNNSGYQKMNMKNENFTELLNEKDLIKTYTSKTFQPVSFSSCSEYDNPISKYIDRLNEYGYLCKRK